MERGKARGKECTLGLSPPFEFFDPSPLSPADGPPVSPAEPAVTMTVAPPPLPPFDIGGAGGAPLSPTDCSGNGSALPNSTKPPSCVALRAASAFDDACFSADSCAFDDACFSGEDCVWYLRSLGISSRSTRFFSFDSKRIVASSVRSMVLTTSGFLYASACCAVREVTAMAQKARRGR